jgi:putative ABC transport system permease protein
VRVQYLGIFCRHVTRDVRRHPLLALLNILSVGLGVAVYLATQIANHSANRAFAATVDIVAGKADLEIRAPGDHLSDAVFPLVAHAAGISAATPIVSGFVTLPDLPGEYLEVLGLDILTNGPFRTFELTNFEAAKFDLQTWLGDADSIALTEEFATRYNLKAGDFIRAQVNGREHRLRVGFILRQQGASVLDSHFAAMDIGWSQELFGRRGELSTIQVRLRQPKGRGEVLKELRELVPKDVTIAPPARRTEQVEKILGGFELNLTAMSLVSLLVGMFLIYNTVSSTVSRRRREIGILRSLGVTRTELCLLFLAEALTLGLTGIILGLVGGLFLAQLMMGKVAETISSLYVLVHVRQIAFEPRMLALAGAIGLIAVLASAWLPARSAALMEPVRALRDTLTLEKSLNPSPAYLAAGVLAILFSVACSFVALTVGPPWLGFGAAFFVLMGFSFVVPALTSHFSDGLRSMFRWLRRRGYPALLEPELAAANLPRALLRNSVTIAAVAAAVAMTVGVAVMTFSFRQTVNTWIEEIMLADLFIAPASNEIVGPSSFIPPEVVRFVEGHPAVVAVDTFREFDVPMGGETARIAVVRSAERRRFQFVAGDQSTIMRRFREEECVLVSESFARRQQVREDGTIELTTPDGPRRFPIAGIFYDYTRDEGIIYMTEKNFVRFWHDDRVNTLIIYLKKNASPDELLGSFRTEFNRSGAYLIYSNKTLRTRVFEIFDETFAVTHVLRMIAVIVAITGIFLSLTILITERSREIAIMRAIGASAAQIRKLLLWETSMIGAMAALVGVLSGLCLSVVLTGVINRAFFGWTIRLAFPWSSLALTPVWVLGAALVAGIIPAWRAGRLVLAENLRHE